MAAVAGGVMTTDDRTSRLRLELNDAQISSSKECHDASISIF